MSAPTLTSLLQGFFTNRLGRQLQASPQTIASYRDAIRLLLLFTSREAKKSPEHLTLADLDAGTIGAPQKPMLCWRHRTAPRGSGAATTPCS